MVSKRMLESLHRINVSSFKDYLKKGEGLKGEVTIGEYTYPLVIVPKKMFISINGNRINIDTSNCNYGGERYWFVCPCCGNTVTTLVPYDGVLKCRKCCNLNYHSQQRTKTDPYYYFALAERIARKVDKNCKLDPIYSYFPPKPKWMKYKKYSELHMKFAYCLQMRNKLWLNSAGNLLNRNRK